MFERLFRTDIGRDQVPQNGTKTTYNGLRAAPRRFLVEIERGTHLFPSRQLVRIAEESAREQLEVQLLSFFDGDRFDFRDRHSHDALTPRPEQVRIGPARRHVREAL